ncbi:hypothetical protein ACFLZX_04170 [Nanoarchaeota archaeon]
MSFIEDYGFLPRELLCGYGCSIGDRCEESSKYKPDYNTTLIEPDLLSVGAPEECNFTDSNKCERSLELLIALNGVVSRHIEKHIYYNHFSDRREAVADFVSKYRFAVDQLFCEYGCKEGSKILVPSNSVKIPSSYMINS